MLPSSSLPTSAPGFRWRKAVAMVLAGIVLVLVFMLYLAPDFMVSMADQLWACF